MIVICVLLLLFLLLIIGIPIAFALAMSGICAILLLGDVPLTYIFQRFYMGSESYSLVALPMFILAGNLMNRGGVSGRLISFAASLMGRVRGGLAMITIVASAFFGAISGTATGTSAAIGSMMIPSMIKKGYDPGYAAAVVSASSSLGIVIPPSLPLILYGSVSGLSVGMLFLAGVPLGILISIVYMIVTHFIAIKYHLPSGENKVNIKSIYKSFLPAIPALTLPVLILGSIIYGIATPTETAGMAVILSIFVGSIYKELSLNIFIQCLKESLVGSAAVMLIIASGDLLGWALTYLEAAQELMNLMLSFATTKISIMLIASVILLIAGFVFDGTVMVIIIVPLFMPLVKHAGIDPLQFAMVVLLCWCIGQQTPPVASGLYVSTAIANVDMLQAARYVVFYIFALFAILLAIVFIPDYVLYFSKLVSGY
ncbi:MAG: TRAP transporter large permease [Smithellaceae bacterium]